ncbi:MAG: hypothetical protein KGQ41_03225 [Alphaproteobacteria bacterium]|nr:hypothetical protein [Alphaproteobacteria bacterium]
MLNPTSTSAGFDGAAAATQIFEQFAQKTGDAFYKTLGEIVIKRTDAATLAKALHPYVKPESRGMGLALLAARAVVLDYKLGTSHMVALDAFNPRAFGKVTGSERSPNEAPAPKDPAPALTDNDDVADFIGGIFGASAIAKPKANPNVYFDHHVYTAAMKLLGVAVPQNIADVLGSYKNADLDGLMKDDLIPVMADDAAAYMHRCGMYVRHSERGPQPRMGGMRMRIITP